MAVVERRRGDVAIRTSLELLLRWSPAQVAFMLQAVRRLTVLAYHGIDDPACFRRQLAYLARTMQPVSAGDLLQAIGGGPSLPARAVLLTFDDGHRSLLEAGVPLLAERGFPGLAFVVPGVLDTDQPFWWTETEQLLRQGGRSARFPGLGPAAVVSALKRLPDAERLAVLEELRASADGPPPRTPQLRRDELPRLEAAGITVGNHTVTHPCLPHCDDAKTGAEISEGHRLLRDALGHEPRTFAYPNGDWDERAERVLTGAGYQAAFLFDHRANPAIPPHPLRISRLRVNSTTSLGRFAMIVSGLHPALHHARGRS
jgi:peptidoglycan/xylan/chitin deacetylase (PgdA/CDA1 family)